MLIPSKSYKKSVPMTISMGASSIDIRHTLRRKGRYHEPTRVKRCHAKSLTLSTSAVIRVIIWALLEKLSSSFSNVSVSAFPFSLVFDEGGGGAEEATSFRTRVFANKTEFSWILSRTWIVVVDSDQSCPVTVCHQSVSAWTAFFLKRLSQEN